MNKTFFIADVHLSAENHHRKSLFLSFLNMVINQKGNLYILGDLFDFWANNKKVLENNLPVLNKLSEISKHGSKTGYVFGNRDFLINKKTLLPFGIDFLGEEAEININDSRIYITHGHTLCASDLKFLKYKKKAWPVFYYLDKILPGCLENHIANRFILQSKKVIDSQDKSALQFSPDVINSIFIKGVNVIICGHAHRLENQIFNGNRFYALPSWENGSGWYLLCDDGKFSLHEFNKQ